MLVQARPAAGPGPSLDARGDLSEQEIVELDERVAGAKATGWGNAWRWAERLLAEVKRRRAAPSAPSDALRTYGQHLTTHMCSSYDNVKCTCGFDAALAASPSVTCEQELNEAWIKGCLAGREEGAAVSRLHGDGLDGEELAEAILAVEPVAVRITEK